MNVIKFPKHRIKRCSVNDVQYDNILDLMDALREKFLESDEFETEYKEYCDEQERIIRERYDEESYFYAYDYSVDKREE